MRTNQVQFSVELLQAVEDELAEDALALFPSAEQLNLLAFLIHWVPPALKKLPEGIPPSPCLHCLCPSEQMWETTMARSSGWGLGAQPDGEEGWKQDTHPQCIPTHWEG